MALSKVEEMNKFRKYHNKIFVYMLKITVIFLYNLHTLFLFFIFSYKIISSTWVLKKVNILLDYTVLIKYLKLI